MIRKILLLMVILAGSGWVIWRVNEPGQQPDKGLEKALQKSRDQAVLEDSPVSFLPADSLAMLRLTDVKAGLDFLGQSPLGRSLAGMNVPKVLQALGASQHDAANVRAVLESGEWRIWKKLFEALFGAETVIGWIPESLQGDIGQSPRSTCLQPELVVISRPEQGAGVIRLLSSFIPGLEQREVPTQQGLDIREVVLDPELSLFHCTCEGNLLLSLDPGSLVRLMQVRQGDVRPLVNDDHFRQERERAAGELAFAYLSGTRLRSLCSDLQGAGDANQAQEAGLRALRSAAFGWNRSDSGLFAQTGTIALIPERLTPVQRRFLSQKSTDPAGFLGMVPGDASLVVWQGGFEPGALWPESGADSELDSQMKDLFGGDWERFKTRLEGRVGVLLRDVDFKAMFPVPDGAFFLPGWGQDGLLTSMAGSLARQVRQATGLALPVRRDKVEGLELEQVPLPFGRGLQPSWAGIGDFEVLATNQDLLLDIWAVRSGGEGLLAQSWFSRAGSPLARTGHSFQFMRVDACLHMVRQFMDWWGDTALATRLSDEEAGRFRVIMDELVTPVLQGLQMFKAFGARTSLSLERVDMQGLLGAAACWARPPGNR
jgi:hypothetical protein